VRLPAPLAWLGFSSVLRARDAHMSAAGASAREQG
jgi:hypothetical protein